MLSHIDEFQKQSKVQYLDFLGQMLQSTREVQD